MTYRNRARLMRALRAGWWCRGGGGRRRRRQQQQFVVGREELRARMRGLRKTNNNANTTITTNNTTNNTTNATTRGDEGGRGDEGDGGGEDVASRIAVGCDFCGCHEEDLGGRPSRSEDGGRDDISDMDNCESNDDDENVDDDDDNDDVDEEYARHESYLKWMDGNEKLERERRRVESLFADLVCSRERCDILSERLSEVTRERDRLLSKSSLSSPAVAVAVSSSPMESPQKEEVGEGGGFEKTKIEMSATKIKMLVSEQNDSLTERATELALETAARGGTARLLPVPSCDAGRSMEPKEEAAKEAVEKMKMEGLVAKNEMHLRQYVLQLSTVAHLTEQNDLLTQRVAALETENEEMGDEMDYLMDEILLLRRGKEGGVDMSKNVDTSHSLGSLMFESLSEDGDDDYESYEDDDNYLDSENFVFEEPTMTNQDVNISTEENARFPPTPCQEEGDLILMHQPVGGEDEGGRMVEDVGIVENVGIVDDGSISLSTLKDLEESMITACASVPVVLTPVAHDNNDLSNMLVPHKDQTKSSFGDKVHVIVAAGNMQSRLVAEVVKESASTVPKADETSKMSIAATIAEIVKSESDFDEAYLMPGKRQLYLSGAEELHTEPKETPSIASLELVNEFTVAILELDEESAVAVEFQDENESSVVNIDAIKPNISNPITENNDIFMEDTVESKVTLLSNKRNELDQQRCVGEAEEDGVIEVFDSHPDTNSANECAVINEKDGLEDGAVMKEFDCRPDTITVDQYGVINDEKREISSDEKRKASKETTMMNLSTASTTCLHSNSADLSIQCTDSEVTKSNIPSSKNRDEVTSLQISTALKKIVLEKTSISCSEIGTESSVVILLDKIETLVGDFDATISKKDALISETNEENIDTANSIQLTREEAKIKIGKIEDFASLHAEVKRVELGEQNWLDGIENDGAGVKAFVSNRDLNSADHYLDQKESRHNACGAITNPQRRIHDDLLVRFRDRTAAREEQYSNSSSSQLTREEAKIMIGKIEEKIEDVASLDAEVKRVELGEQNWLDGIENDGAGVKAFVSNRDLNSADHYLDQKESRHNACGAITNPQRRIHDDLLVRFRDRTAAQEEQYSNSSSSSKSYEDFLSFAAAPMIHGEGRNLSEELSSPTTASPQAKKENAVKMLSKLWNRKSRRAV